MHFFIIPVSVTFRINSHEVKALLIREKTSRLQRNVGCGSSNNGFIVKKIHHLIKQNIKRKTDIINKT